MIRIVDDCSFPDALPGGWSRRLRDERTLIVTVHGQDVDWTPAPDVLRDPRVSIGSDGFVRGVAISGNTYGGVNRLMMGSASGWMITEYPCVGQRGCDIDWHGDHFDVIVQTENHKGLRLHFGNGFGVAPTAREVLISPNPGPQGFLSFDATDTIKPVTWTVELWSFTVDGLRLTFPQQFLDGIVGLYADNPDHVGGVSSQGRFTLTTIQPTDGPRVSAINGRSIIVCGLTDWRCLYAEIPPYPAFVPESGTNVPIVPPPPPPPPPPEVSMFPLICYLVGRDGLTLSVDPEVPTVVKGFPHQFGWERVSVSADGIATFVEAKRDLSVSPEGRLGTQTQGVGGWWERGTLVQAEDGRMMLVYAYPWPPPDLEPSSRNAPRASFLLVNQAGEPIRGRLQRRRAG